MEGFPTGRVPSRVRVFGGIGWGSPIFMETTIWGCGGERRHEGRGVERVHMLLVQGLGFTWTNPHELQSRFLKLLREGGNEIEMGNQRGL